jgi:hypothetical protein
VTDPDQEFSRTIRCFWTKELANNEWVIGCAFLTPLNDGELDQLIRCGLTTTDNGGPRRKSGK